MARHRFEFGPSARYAPRRSAVVFFVQVLGGEASSLPAPMQREWAMFLRSHLVVVSVVLLGTLALATVSAQEKSLGLADLISLIELQIDDDAIVAKLKKGGLAAALDDAALAKLKAAGASEALLKAVQDAAKTRKPAATGAAITFPDIVKLVSLNIDDDTILKRLEKSPTVLTPSAEQLAELKQAGASDKLIAALRGVRPAAPQVAELITDFAIVLDCSGSMKEATPEGESKMTAAKRVVTDLVEKMPEGLNVTFVIYGHEAFGAANDPRNCQAVKVARPLSALDASGKGALAQLIAGLKPTGTTPIALSLKTAGEELKKNDAYCGVVLITDGLETCNGDPVAEAAALAANPKLSFGVHVVGFGAKPEEDKILAKIAEAGEGKYFDADSAAELSKAIGTVIDDLDKKARKLEVKTVDRRAVKVLKPEVEGFPPVGEIQLVSYGLGSVSVDSKGNYGEEVRIPSPKTAYDVKWSPKSGGSGGQLAVAMLKGRVFEERKLVVIKPEDYLGLVRVNGTGKVGRISVYRPGLGSTIVFQECKKYGELMVVPAGKYNIRVDGDNIEEDFEVEAGKLHELE
ncbi:MAG: VWA domain-containing protein [Planctomycetaceae bacterium]|nr:VWA domain-containing protein [Planctomycetaceae bacterium]